MATGTRTDPYRGFRFRVEVEGIQTAAFSEATVPSSETDAADYREGTDPPAVRKLSGLNKYGNLTLKKGLSDSADLYEWRKDVEQTGSGGNRKNVSLILLDERGQDKARWDIAEAWPVKYESTGFNATGNEVMVETLEIVHEGIARVS